MEVKTQKYGTSAQSIYLPHVESIGNLCLGSRLNGHAGLHGRRVVNLRGLALVKMGSRSRKSKYFRLVRPHRNFCYFGTRSSTLLSSTTEKIYSSGISTSKREVASQGMYVLC